MKKLVLALLLCMALTGFANADLVVGYGFNGDLSDGSENVYDGISSGEGVSFTEGVIDQCLLLDEGGYVDVPLPFEANPFSGDNDFSIVAWVRQPDTEDQAGLITSCKENPDEQEEHPMLIAYNLDEEQVSTTLVYDNSWVDGIGWEGEVDIGDGQWHHYAITYESAGTEDGEFIAYLDGVAVVTESMYPDCDITDNIVRIGQSIHWDPPSQWYGVIDELGIYNHTLTEEEILTVMEEGFGSSGPIARNPVPANGEIYAPLDTDLSWDPPRDEIIGITYDVYFGTEPNELKPEWYGNNKIADGITETTVLNDVIAPLDYGTWYYWRVDTWDPNEGVPQLYEGREWSFRTAPEWVVITGQPQDAVVPEGDDAVFTVVAVNDKTYQWYYSTTPDGIGTELTGETSDTLVVENVQLANEGYYYCEVMNPAMPDATSERARLLTERMMAHWKLDKNLNDEVSSLNDGTSPMTMKYSTDGIDGSAAQIEEPDRYIIIDNNIGTFPGVTVSAWINPTDIAGWHAVIDGFYTGDNNVSLFQEDDLLMGEVLDSGWVEGTGVVVGEWQHAALVHSSVDEVLQLYLNGELISEDVADPDTWAQVGPLTMGAYVDAEDPNNPIPIDHFAGLLDDVRIYNYALSCVQVATLYTGFMPPGTEVCCGDYDTDLSGPEDVPDCIVDIYDVVAFVKDWWLECNIVPDCAFELP